ncbi:MAG: hypothetical protein HOC71_04415, partial [Candidatus Latescibacteria bacterium]|nr:hypothetical protein [Candidatus Latescibacterota bacterium]
MGISHFRNRQAQWLDLVALVIVCCAGWTLRGMLLFGDDLIPGLNGAYYLVQARAILRSGLPGIPDFPLLFYLHAAWAGLMSFVLPRDQALIAAVKLTDTVVPVLLVIPVFMFVRSFAREHKVANNTFIATITIGLITVLNSSLLRMLGDFQKNAAGLPAGLLMIYFIYRATKYNRRHSYSLAVLFGVVSSITHIGVIALCATVIILFLVSSYFIKTLRKRVLITAIVVFFAFGIGLSIDLIFDQERVERLAGVVTSPSSIVRGPDSDMQRVPAPSPAGHGTPSFPDVILGLT